MWTRNIVLMACALCATLVERPQAQVSHPAPQRALPNVPAFRPFTDRPRQYVLVEPFKYRSPHGELIIVPAGFVTDFASIPGLLQSSFGPSVHDLPALVHDYLYWRHACTRSEADEIFYRALQEFGVSQVRILFIKVGLGLGGESAYEENGRDRRARLPRIIPESHRSIPIITWREFRKQLRQQGLALDPLDAKPPLYCGSV